eukprot:gene10818-10974_t
MVLVSAYAQNFAQEGKVLEPGTSSLGAAMKQMKDKGVDLQQVLANLQQQIKEGSIDASKTQIFDIYVKVPGSAAAGVLSMVSIGKSQQVKIEEVAREVVSLAAYCEEIVVCTHKKTTLEEYEKQFSTPLWQGLMKESQLFSELKVCDPVLLKELSPQKQQQIREGRAIDLDANSFTVGSLMRAIRTAAKKVKLAGWSDELVMLCKTLQDVGNKASHDSKKGLVTVADANLAVASLNNLFKLML